MILLMFLKLKWRQDVSGKDENITNALHAKNCSDDRLSRIADLWHIFIEMLTRN